MESRQDLGLEQLLDAHRELWDWLSHNPRKINKDYFEEKGFGVEELPKNLCWACEFARRIVEEEIVEEERLTANMCEYCPFDWRGGYCGAEGAEYKRFKMLWKRQFEEGEQEEMPKLMREIEVAAKTVRDIPLHGWALERVVREEVEKYGRKGGWV